MKAITFDVQYWPGLQGDKPMRIAEVDGDHFIEMTQGLLRDPTVQGIQITIGKERGEEFF